MERRLVGRGWGRLAQHRQVPTRVAAILSGLLLVLVAASPVLGHAELATSDPEDGAVLDTPPTTITTTFTEGLDAGKSSIRVLGPDGDTEVAEAHPAKNGSKTIRVDDLVLAPGTYVVRWTAAATDGHIERGRFQFTVNEPTPAPATPSPTPTAATASAAPSAAPTASPTAAPTPSPAQTPAPSGDQAPASSSSDVLLPIVAALALVAVVGFLVLRRNRAA